MKKDNTLFTHMWTNGDWQHSKGWHCVWQLLLTSVGCHICLAHWSLWYTLLPQLADSPLFSCTDKSVAAAANKDGLRPTWFNFSKSTFQWEKKKRLCPLNSVTDMGNTKRKSGYFPACKEHFIFQTLNNMQSLGVFTCCSSVSLNNTCFVCTK